MLKQFKKLKLAGIVGGLMALMTANNAFAATATGNMLVTATVLSSCTIVPLPLAFGNYTSSANLDATATMTVICTLGSGYNIRMDSGTNGTTVTGRKAKSALNTDTLNYSLFRDTGRTQNWGQTDGTDTLPGTGSGLPQILTVYGRIPSGQNTSAGAYTDSVVVTVSY